MATAHLYGAAEIEYESGVYTVTHQLAVPLMIAPAWGFQATRQRPRWEAWTADGTERTVFTMGEVTHELQATVRFEDEPEALLALLVAGLEDDATLLYRPYGSAVSGYLELPLKLVAVVGAPAGQVLLKPDRERFAFGEYEATLQLRRVDGGDLEGLL